MVETEKKKSNKERKMKGRKKREVQRMNERWKVKRKKKRKKEGNFQKTENEQQYATMVLISVVNEVIQLFRYASVCIQKSVRRKTRRKRHGQKEEFDGSVQGNREM